jgi:hypothetical protein
MPIEVEAPDGSVIEFPDGTPRATMQAAMAKRFAPAKAQPRTISRDFTGAMAQLNSHIPLGDEVAAAGNTAVDVITGRTPLAGAGAGFKRNLGKQRAYEGDFQAAHPHISAVMRGTGDATGALIPGGRLVEGLPTATRVVNAGRGAVTAGLIGSGYAAADRGSAQERLKAASRAAMSPLTLGLGAVGGALAPALRSGPRPVHPDVVAARARNIPLTPGQASGSPALRATENALTSAPILGDRIAAAQTRSIEGFNRAGLTDALAEVGHTLPDEVATGHAAIAHTRQALNRVYQDLRPTGGVRQDEPMVQGITAALQDVMPTLGDTHQHRLLNIVDQRVTQPLQAAGGFMDADTFQSIERKLDYEIGRHQRATDPDQNAIGEALDGVRAAIRDAAARQNPEYAQGKAAADRGWARFATARDAARSNRAMATGIYTPNEFLGAVKRGDDTIGRVSEGEGLGQDLGAMGQRLLPNNMPDSGTARRGVLTGGIGGLGVQAMHDPMGAAVTGGAYVAGASAASLPYTQAGQALFNRVLDNRIASNERQQALAALQNLALQSPEARALYQQVLARLPRGAGIAGASAQAASGASSQ